MHLWFDHAIFLWPAVVVWSSQPVTGFDRWSLNNCSTSVRSGLVAHSGFFTRPKIKDSGRGLRARIWFNMWEIFDSAQPRWWPKSVSLPSRRTARQDESPNRSRPPFHHCRRSSLGLSPGDPGESRGSSSSGRDELDERRKPQTPPQCYAQVRGSAFSKLCWVFLYLGFLSLVLIPIAYVSFFLPFRYAQSLGRCRRNRWSPRNPGFCSRGVWSSDTFW